jgi:hypothetical protein
VVNLENGAVLSGAWGGSGFPTVLDLDLIFGCWSGGEGFLTTLARSGGVVRAPERNGASRPAAGWGGFDLLHRGRGPGLAGQALCGRCGRPVEPKHGYYPSRRELSVQGMRLDPVGH